MTEVVVEIESLAPGGDAVGRQQDEAAVGRATFVSLAAPGERVRARLVRQKARVAWGELLAIERPGPERVPPPCPLFGTCGGCQWQHVTLAAQQDAKRQIVQRALGITIPPVVTVGPPFGYRDRARLTVSHGKLGFKMRRSHDVVDVPSCPLLSAPLARALPAVRALAAGLPAGAQIALQAGREGVHVDVADAAPDARGCVEETWEALRAAGVAGVSIDGQPALGVAAVDVAEEGGAPLPIPAGAFAQSGRAANAALVAAVQEAVGGSPGAVIELCAGSGNFTRHLTRVAASVRASDGDAAAVARGRQVAPQAAWSTRPPPTPPNPAVDLVLLDPPREGADAATLAVAETARRRVVYVSCDPQTLARDARRLHAAGLRLTSARAFDLMPQTYHIEVVAIFDRP